MKWIKKRTLIYYREKSQWIENIRLYFSTLLLDFAEKLPEVKAGYLHNLQYIRQRQRIDADNSFKECQIPKNTSVTYLGFQLIELYHLEDFKKLKKSLTALFPDANILRQPKFDKFDGSISGGGWQHQGHLIPENSSYFFSAEQRATVEDLSTDIAYITLETQSITPSLKALILKVRLADDTKHKLGDFFKKKHLFPTKVGRYYRKSDFLPHTATSYLYSGAGIEFKNWNEALQFNIEKNILASFPGYFCSQKTQNTKLPRIDIFTIKIKEEDKEEDTINKPNFWRRSLGLDEYPPFIKKKQTIHAGLSKRDTLKIPGLKE